MRIIDAHHHIWRRADLPWLLGPTQPRIFGPYDGIKRDYLIEEFLADIEGTGVSQSVYVQANFAPNWFLDEVRIVSEANRRTGWPHAIVAYCDMTQADATRDLERLAANSLVRGIRHQMHHHANPLYRFAADGAVVGSDHVVRNAKRLADFGLVFELQIFAHQVDAALRLVRACPAVTFVLQHAGMPEDLSPGGKAFWREKMTALAAEANVVCKLSGFGTFIHQNDADHIKWTMGEALALFGPQRCLYGSNFPIEKLWTDYRSIINAVKAVAGALPPDDAALIMGEVAARVYRL